MSWRRSTGPAPRSCATVLASGTAELLNPGGDCATWRYAAPHRLGWTSWLMNRRKHETRKWQMPRARSVQKPGKKRFPLRLSVIGRLTVPLKERGKMNTTNMWCKALVVAGTLVSAVPVRAQNNIVANFDAVDTSVTHSVDAALYLRSVATGLTNVTPGTSVKIINTAFPYDGYTVVASSAPNILSQVGSNDPVTFTLVFGRPDTAFPLSSVSFTRAMLLAGPSGITHPEWSAHALDASGTELSFVGEGLIASFSNVPAQTFTLSGPGIRSVRFDSDNHHFAAFSAVQIDDLILTP